MYKQITVVGNLGKDPEIKQLSNKAWTAKFSIACNESWTKNGEKHTKTTWFFCEIYQPGEQGLVTNFARKFLKKGQQVMLVGSPEIDEWEKDGKTERMFKIKLGPQSTIRLLGAKEDRPAAAADKPAPTGGGTSETTDDDIPF